ncbi:MAG: transcription-repair coupling factor [Dehalococcoidia bacterium]|nr:transcription-repair coupling factor [Dehalococcoidia bacterium]
MNITGLLAIAQDLPAYRALTSRLVRDDARVLVIEAARPYLIAALYHHLARPLLVVTARAEGAKHMAGQLAAWTGVSVGIVPEPDLRPYQRASAESVGDIELIEVLAHLTEPLARPLLVTSAAALTRLLPEAAVFREARRNIYKGDRLNPLKLMAELTAWGYDIQALTELPGQASRRGGIVDIFPPANELPVRLEFFGNTLDNVRLFDPASQRSMRPVDEITFGPASATAPIFIGGRERCEQAFAGLDFSCLNYEERGRYEEALARLVDGGMPDEAAFYAPLFNRESLLAYLPEQTLVIVDDPEGVRRELNLIHEEAEKVLSSRLAAQEVPPGFPRPYHQQDALESQFAARHRLVLPVWEGAGEDGLRLDFGVLPSYAGQLSRWTEQVNSLLGENKHVVVISHQASRLAELLGRDENKLAVTEAMTTPPIQDGLTIASGIIAGGWSVGDTYLFTDKEIFGFIKQQRQLRRRPIARRKLYVDLRPGDYVVHVEHGIGRFGGIITRDVEGLTREYMLLAYAEGARLYVPTDQIDRVARYVGASDVPPALSRLGSLEWVKSKERARVAAEEIARDLLKLYAARELTPGYVYSPDNAWQMEMEAAFPYVETSDQLAAIAQIKEDMARPRPMDRLVTGDVGYGKTEVALRAAFKAVMDGKQVAVLVPTTVLAQQHFTTFHERLTAFPVRVEMLSRFRGPREQQEIIASLAEGRIDIVIGTHRLLQKDVVFKDLGLAIIDEEQRFGVSHKEHFKRLRREIGVLALSATPIPRTLHMSLVGVRDMSVMETPPEERLPIKTYVAEYDEHLVREAIMRELERGGQVFFVHNRVLSIGIMAEKLRSLIPEARIAVGHGQTEEDTLEAVMADFMQGRVDVLLCTTIIESGLDVPNANTLIVNQADRLGLTQLYQLRGRVGRGANLAYAYFLYDRGKRLTEDAGKRLRTIFEATELGAGFGVAMKDLEIRGAGNILGVRQSGHINAVGFSYYTQLLAEAVEDLKSERTAVQTGKMAPRHPRIGPPAISLPWAAYIPEDYVADTEMRLSLYQGLAEVRDLDAVARWDRDFCDRFGTMPLEVANLLKAVKIKVLATKAGLASVSVEGGDIVLRRPPGMAFEVSRLSPPYHLGLKVAPFQVRLNREVLGENWQDVLEGILERLAEPGINVNF